MLFEIALSVAVEIYIYIFSATVIYVDDAIVTIEI